MDGTWDPVLALTLVSSSVFHLRAAQPTQEIPEAQPASEVIQERLMVSRLGTASSPWASVSWWKDTAAPRTWTRNGKAEEGCLYGSPYGHTQLAPPGWPWVPVRAVSRGFPWSPNG